MKKYYKYLIISLLFCFSANKVHSTHIIGGELNYRCLDENTHFYQFFVKLYRDCDSTTGYHAPFDSVIYAAIYDDNENLVIEFNMELPPNDILENNTYNLCLVSPPNICVNEAVYTAYQYLNDTSYSGGYYMTYQRCCRNNIVKNIVNPLSTGASWNLYITEDNIAQCNSSPFYMNYPPTIVCLGHQLVYDHSAFDPDDDSLVYSICEASTISFIDAAPKPSEPPSKEFNVQYKNPYSYKYPMDASLDSLRIDPKTGILTVTPTAAGQYVVAICVSEYRNGVLLSVKKRDFQFNVAKCIEGTYADFTYTPDPCRNNFVQFTNTSFNARWSEWDFGVVDTFMIDTSHQDNPSFLFPYFDKTYNIKLLINDTLDCVDSITKPVTIAPPMQPKFAFNEVCVFDTTALFDSSYVNSFNGNIIKWYWDFGDGGTDSVQNPIHVFTNDKIYYLTKLIITTDKNCTDSIIDTATYHFIPILDAGRDTILNLGESAYLLGSGADIYDWTPGVFLDDSTVSTPLCTPVVDDSTLTYYLLGKSVFGCENRDSVKIHVYVPQIVIPSAFTPNGDNVNDVIYLIPVNIKELEELKIFNRWGEIVFETTDLKAGWDGTFKGEPQEVGTYVYYYIALTPNGAKRTGKGNISLLR